MDFLWIESDAKILADGIFSALRFLHNNQFMHLDLKPTVN